MFVNNDIRKEMYKGADANVDAQFKKLYIYHMENVSILFADIKVGTLLIHIILIIKRQCNTNTRQYAVNILLPWNAFWNMYLSIISQTSVYVKW